MNDNWIVDNLNNALATWNGKLTEIWSLVSQSPETFKGGTIWGTIVNIHQALQAVGYGLLILFFAMGVFKSAASFREFRRPEQALRLFIRFLMTKAAISSGMEIMSTIFTICGGVVSTIAGNMGTLTTTAATLPTEIVDAVEAVTFLESIPLWLVSFLGSLFITVLSFIMILTVYGRFFKLYLFTALAPIPLATFGGEGTSQAGKTFIKSYVGVCMEGAVIVLACLIYSAFLSSGTTGLPNTGTTAVTLVWAYLGETVFNMMILVGLVKGADHVVKEIFGT
ncbi:hypothetical protein D7X33_41025 [Butyricicoccus sp. 1XD8-22]|nr:hypothetical protein D7X33_41025 [Butyricicoccus sp. 1XD8-22]